jgi:hypothetical protein
VRRCTRDQGKVLLFVRARLQRSRRGFMGARRRLLRGGERVCAATSGLESGGDWDGDGDGDVDAVRQRNDCTACRCRHKWASRAKR